MSNLHITKQQSNKLEGKKKYQPSNKEAIENQLENVKHLIEEESMKPLIEQQTNRLEGEQNVANKVPSLMLENTQPVSEQMEDHLEQLLINEAAGENPLEKNMFATKGATEANHQVKEDQPLKIAAIEEYQLEKDQPLSQVEIIESPNEAFGETFVVSESYGETLAATVITEEPDMKTENVGMDPKEADTDYSGAAPFSEDNNNSKKEVASNAFSIFNETNKKDESEARSEFSIGTEVINVDYLTSTDNSETTTSILEAAHDEEVPKKLFYDVPPKTPVSKSSKSVLEIGKSYR